MSEACRPPTRWTAIGVVEVLVATLVVLAGLSAGAAVVSRVQVDSSTERLQTRWAPAHVAAAALRRAYGDQATAELGYLFTGSDSYLRSYEAAGVDAQRAEAALTRALPGDARLPGMLAALDGAVERWRTTAVQPQLDARRLGSIASSSLLADIRASSSLYNVVRARALAVEEYAHSLETAELRRIADEQREANVITAIAVGLAVLVAGAGVMVLRRVLVRPARNLLREVDVVAAGNYQHPVTVSGPREFTAVADAVHRMRANILGYGEQLAETERKLTLAEEQDRVGADLRERTVRRVFALGLALTSTAGRFPELAPALRPLIEETDDILRELRSVILGLRPGKAIDDLGAQVSAAASESSRSLGITPEVTVTGPVDRVPPAIASEMVRTLRETLTDVGGHAHATVARIEVCATPDELRLRVTDDGEVPAVPGAEPFRVSLATVRARAERLGGTVTTGNRSAAGPCLEWRVPIVRRAPGVDGEHTHGVQAVEAVEVVEAVEK